MVSGAEPDGAEDVDFNVDIMEDLAMLDSS